LHEIVLVLYECSIRVLGTDHLTNVQQVSNTKMALTRSVLVVTYVRVRIVRYGQYVFRLLSLTSGLGDRVAGGSVYSRHLWGGGNLPPKNLKFPPPPKKKIPTEYCNLIQSR